jgi:hypothetical protein
LKNETTIRRAAMQSATITRSASFRYAVYLLCFAASIAVVAGRTMAVKSDRGKTPFLSANDRSRWATIRALVDYGTYELDRVIFPRAGKRDVDWYSIDLVRHRGRDGREHYFSSKPPLFPTLLAGEYWLIQRATGATLQRHTFPVARAIILITNAIPLAIYFGIMATLFDRLAHRNWGRMFVVFAAAWGTFLTTFGVTLNNHLPAAISVAVAVYAAYRALYRDEDRRVWYALAGLAGAFAVANELPALSFFCLLTLAFGIRSLSRTAKWYLPAAAAVAIAFFTTNYIAHDCWNPAYSHRRDGAEVARVPAVDDPSTAGSAKSVLDSLRAAGLSFSSKTTVAPSAREQRWVVYDTENSRRWALVRDGQTLVLREWDNWYEYDGSYWLPTRLRGVDRGEPSRLVYAFHVLAGHHGVFSLTPIWILSLAGMLIWLRGSDPKLRVFSAAVLLLTVVCLAFYVARPLIDRNYGGVACGFRWVFWCTPLWLITLVPAADRMASSRWGRGIAVVCLAISVFSASYASLNPWSHPWLYNLWGYLGWLQP